MTFAEPRACHTMRYLSYKSSPLNIPAQNAPLRALPSTPLGVFFWSGRFSSAKCFKLCQGLIGRAGRNQAWSPSPGAPVTSRTGDEACPSWTRATTSLGFPLPQHVASCSTGPCSPLSLIPHMSPASAGAVLSTLCLRSEFQSDSFLHTVPTDQLSEADIALHGLISSQTSASYWTGAGAASQ